MEGIDPVTLISLVSGLIVALAGFYKGNKVATTAVETLQSLMDIADSFYKGDADKVWTTEEDAAFGKAIRTSMIKIHDGVIPAFLNSLKKE